MPGRSFTATVGVTAAAALLAACGGSGPQGAAAPPADGDAAPAAGPCRVSLPGGRIPAAAQGLDFGNRDLAVALWPKGRLVAGRLPDGSSYAETRPDGSIVAKLGWWRGAAGRLRIEGERLDAPAPPLRADVPDGYGPTGFQATALTFPATGCWRVRGSVGGGRLTFVVLVRRR